jgi:dipeptidyl aminopeptidase/acylaminoacyl peptidase
MAQPFDTRRFELTGEAFPIAEHVGSNLAMGYYALSTNGALAYRSGVSGGGTSLTWFDRQGKVLSTLGPTAQYAAVALSPDGKRVAVDETTSSEREIWTLDIARGVPSRFTTNGGVNFAPVWSPDGARIAFGTQRITLYSTREKDSPGTGEDRELTKAGVPQSWSPDGKYLLITEQVNAGLWVLPTPSKSAGSAEPAPYLHTQFRERQGQFSPDGRWVAYVSDEAGEAQVYVQSFPLGPEKVRVSTNGGAQPRWRRDGKEIFYIATDGKLMAAPVKTSPHFEAGAPTALFRSQIVSSGSAGIRYDVTPDGKQFLVNSLGNGNEAGTQITVVLNWQAGMKR